MLEMTEEAPLTSGRGRFQTNNQQYGGRRRDIYPTAKGKMDIVETVGESGGE